MSTRINLWLIPGSYSPTSTASTSSPLQLTISEDVLEIRSRTCAIEVLSLFHSTFPAITRPIIGHNRLSYRLGSAPTPLRGIGCEIGMRFPGHFALRMDIQEER